MVFQQKVGSATKNKSKKAMQSPKPSTFELDAHDDDDSEDVDSDDFAESSDKEMDSDDVQEPPKTSNKKTPQAKTPSKQTPAKQTPGKQNLAKQTPSKQNLAKQTPGKTPNKKNYSLVTDKKVNFELAAAKTPTATDSQVGKRQATPASKGKQGVQEFKGLKAGLKNKSQTSLKMDEEDSDADEEEDDEEEDDDDDDQEEDSDDDDQEEDDDDKEEDDNEDGSKQNVLKSKLKQKIGKDEEEGDEDDDEEEEEDDDDEGDDSKQNVLKSKSKQKIENNQNSQQVKNKTPLKKASSPTETDDSLTKQNEKNLAIEQKNKEVEDLRDAKQLLVRNLPNDITYEEVKSLSDDIIHVTLPDPLFVKKRHFKTVYGFVQFASEEKAEKNYATFQNQKLRGVPIDYDYLGVKSKNPKTKDFTHTAIYDAKKLHITGLPIDVKVMQIAELTPSSISILVTASIPNRTAYVNFDSEEAAAEAFEANKKAKINGKPVTVLYAVERKFGSKVPFKRVFPQDGRPPFAKRPRQDLDASSQD